MITFLNALLLAALGPLFFAPVLLRKLTPAKVAARKGDKR